MNKFLPITVNVFNDSESAVADQQVNFPTSHGSKICENCGCTEINMGFCDECGSLLEEWLLNWNNLVEFTRPPMEDYEVDSQ